MLQHLEARRSTIATTFGTLMAAESASFFIGAALHLGVPVALGPLLIHEPRIVPATVVESICGLALGVGAYAVLAGRSWAWLAAVGAHAIGVAGVLLGMTAIALGRGPHTTLNDTYHRVILAVLLIGLGWLLTSAGRVIQAHRPA